LGIRPVRIYLDTSPIIYVVEETVPYYEVLDRRFIEKGTTLVISDMGRLECRVKPLRDNNTRLLTDYNRFFQFLVQEIVTLTPDVIDLATEIRAIYRFPTSDAIHLAAATIARCDSFLTNDFRLRQYDRMLIETIS
jgi:uncharacterized protein